MNEGLTVTQTGRLLTLRLRCADEKQASEIRDILVGDIADFGRCTIEVGRRQAPTAYADELK